MRKLLPCMWTRTNRAARDPMSMLPINSVMGGGLRRFEIGFVEPDPARWAC